MLSGKDLPNNDLTHIADGKLKKQSAKAMEKQRQETEVAAVTVTPAMVVHNSLLGPTAVLMKKIKQVKITSTVKASLILMTIITRTMTMEVKKINWVICNSDRGWHLSK